MLNVLTYVEAIREARNEKELYNVSLNLVRLGTPLEVEALMNSGAITYAPFKAWLTRLYGEITQENPHIARYAHNRVADGASLYSSGGPAGDKTLLVGFTTRTHDFFGPTPLILQYFPDTHFDVLVLRDTNEAGFVAGIRGYAPSFTEAFERLRTDIGMADYREIRCLGASSGAGAALLAGCQLGATLSISLCGRPPTLVANAVRMPEAVRMEKALRKCNPERAIAVYPAKHSEDATNARKLARLVKLTLHPVAGIADHALTAPLLRRGELGQLFQAIGLNAH